MSFSSCAFEPRDLLAGGAHDRLVRDGLGLLDALFDRAPERQVLLDAAGEVGDLAVAGERVDVVAHALDEVAVVADDDERAGPGVEQVLERGQGVDVEVVGRLVEQQDVGLAHQQAHQLQAPALAAGEVLDQRAGLLAAEAEALDQAARR